jgi:aspartate racemase
LGEFFQLVDDQRWELLASMLAAKVTALKNAGADFAVISANTPHILIDQVLAQSPLPLISIVDVTLEAAKRMSVKKVGLLGTKFVMQANFFEERFSRDSISVVVPHSHEQHYIQEKLVNEIEVGVFKEETRAALVSIIERMKEQDNIDAAILGCTELPLILGDNDATIPLLNTTSIHVEEICKYCIG